jgi:protein gp37
MARRLQAFGNPAYRQGFRLAIHHDRLAQPLGWKTPRRVFVCSMGDLFHEAVPSRFIEEVFDTMVLANPPPGATHHVHPRHLFQVLTKRISRARLLSYVLPWPPHIWLGTSVEDAAYLGRLDDLRRTGAKTKFVSFEPLLGQVDGLDLTGIDWVIVGGETGPGARPMEEAWVDGIHELCRQRGVPFFFKQWGDARDHGRLLRAGRLYRGAYWNEMPV